jgi:hypothetical protein
MIENSEYQTSDHYKARDLLLTEGPVADKYNGRGDDTLTPI